MTALEIRMTLYALALVVIAAGLLYERSHGEHLEDAKQTQVETIQQTKDSTNAQNAVDTFTHFTEHLEGSAPGSGSAPAATAMRVCIASRSVSSRSPASGTQPSAPAVSRTGGSVQTGTESSVDIGTSVQDITLSCMLGIADANQLWQLAMKQAGK